MQVRVRVRVRRDAAGACCRPGFPFVSASWRPGFLPTVLPTATSVLSCLRVPATRAASCGVAAVSLSWRSPAAPHPHPRHHHRTRAPPSVPTHPSARAAPSAQIQLRRTRILISAQEYQLLCTCIALRQLNLLVQPPPPPLPPGQALPPRPPPPPAGTQPPPPSLSSALQSLPMDMQTMLDLSKRVVAARTQPWWYHTCSNFVLFSPDSQTFRCAPSCCARGRERTRAAEASRPNSRHVGALPDLEVCLGGAGGTSCSAGARCAALANASCRWRALRCPGTGTHMGKQGASPALNGPPLTSAAPAVHAVCLSSCAAQRRRPGAQGRQHHVPARHVSRGATLS